MFALPDTPLAEDEEARPTKQTKASFSETREDQPPTAQRELLLPEEFSGQYQVNAPEYTSQTKPLLLDSSLARTQELMPVADALINTSSGLFGQQKLSVSQHAVIIVENSIQQQRRRERCVVAWVCVFLLLGCAMVWMMWTHRGGNH